MDEIWKQMISGEIYDATHPELIRLLNETKDKLQIYNRIQPTNLAERERMLKKILGKSGIKPFINQPFYCDYGLNISVGDRFFANFHFTVLDEAPVTIGNDAFIGPNVSIYTACHPTDPIARRTRQEWALPVSIGNDVWIGGSVTILPGVTIGDNCTIGAGSVVVSDIPANSIAVGNPCRVIKKLPLTTPTNEVK